MSAEGHGRARKGDDVSEGGLNDCHRRLNASGQYLCRSVSIGGELVTASEVRRSR